MKCKKCGNEMKLVFFDDEPFFYRFKYACSCGYCFLKLVNVRDDVVSSGWYKSKTDDLMNRVSFEKN